MVSTFLNEFETNGDRGYGFGMFMLFDKWKTSGTVLDPFLPAKEQFSGINLNSK